MATIPDLEIESASKGAVLHCFEEDGSLVVLVDQLAIGGACVSIDLSREQASQLRDWLEHQYLDKF